MPDKPSVPIPTPPNPPDGDQNEHAYRHREAQEPRDEPSSTATTPEVVPSSPTFPALPLALPIPAAATVSFFPDSTIDGRCDSFVIDNATLQREMVRRPRWSSSRAAVLGHGR